MKRIHFAVLLLLILAGTVISCRKTGQQSFPVTFYSSAIMGSSSIRMFAGGTEIKDTAVISKFINKSSYFNLSSVDPTDYITFESSDTAVIRNRGTKFFISHTADLFLLYSATTMVMIDPADRAAVLLDTMQAYKYKKIAVPAGTNLLNWITKEVWVARGDYQALDISYLSYKISIPGTIRSGVIPNEFYEGCIGAFRSTDTVAFQTCRLRMIAR
jgi:hypothetical protein